MITSNYSDLCKMSTESSNDIELDLQNHQIKIELKILETENDTDAKEDCKLLSISETTENLRA